MHVYTGSTRSKQLNASILNFKTLVISQIDGFHLLIIYNIKINWNLIISQKYVCRSNRQGGGYKVSSLEAQIHSLVVKEGIRLAFQNKSTDGQIDSMKSMRSILLVRNVLTRGCLFIFEYCILIRDPIRDFEMDGLIFSLFRF